MSWVGTFEPLVPTFRTTRCHFQKDNNIINNHRNENLKSQTKYNYI
jgi:hypothetical protein